PPRELVAAPPRRAAGNGYLGFQQQLGGPDGYLYAVSAGVAGRLDLARGTWLQGNAELRLLDNYGKFNYTADSSLPRVRTHVREYLTDARLNLPNAQITNFERLGDAVYSLVYAGWLEPMYAGVGGELMWRPQRGRVAVGLDLNRVRQRNFNQHLGLRDYRVDTGHLTLYWDSGWHGVQAAVSAGRYLAGDRGITVDLARAYANGTRIGLWATKTSVSAAAFGEGSFDKGVYVSIPFDLLFSVWSKETMKIVWQPLIRDGGARLDRAVTLWGLTAPSAQ
ncbi:MAG: YjbH domain-containing protein, partial [Burkholderiales bacterium]|nr:YjbH domain-containing protein [Burkholderiales bacterium]